MRCGCACGERCVWKCAAATCWRSIATGGLLVRHSYQQPDLWMLPGGGLARGEDAAAAAMRELAEETGCRLVQGIWFGSDRIAMPGGWRNRIEMVTGQTDDAPRADGREIAEARARYPSRQHQRGGPSPGRALARMRGTKAAEHQRGEVNRAGRASPTPRWAWRGTSMANISGRKRDVQRLSARATPDPAVYEFTTRRAVFSGLTPVIRR
jgi:ADP-ribose pyrophosphatase YjhB (NUDIX family)